MLKSSVNMNFTPSKEEQAKIGKYLRELDDIIPLHQREYGMKGGKVNSSSITNASLSPHLDFRVPG